MSMDYFRRPVLVGNNLIRTARASIRGSARRAEADGFSAVPYFPGATVGQTLLVAVDGGAPITVTLTDSNAAGTSITLAVSDINTALAGVGEAFDADGSIAIKSLNATSVGFIEVTGGSAATALGFNVSLGKIRAAIGETYSSPEGRVGNAFGTAAPNKGENLTAESVNRAFARVTANSDVLFSEHMRADALPKNVAFTTSDGKYLTPTLPDATRIFTGLDALSAASTKTDLSPFFYLIDSATGLPAASRVVGVVRGTPAGLPPYADATTWTGGGATGNVLGVILSKSSLAITSIKNGKVITCTGATFLTTSKVVPGDYVEITGALNTVPWSNNGNRWVVDEVITETSLSVRPMSYSEMVQFGPVSTEVHPLLELNGSGTGFGTATVRNGTYCNDVKLVVDPKIPTGSTYVLYAASPGGIRDRKVYEDNISNVMSRYIGTDQRPIANTLITSPTVTSFSAASVIISSGTARFNGRLVRIPALTWANTDFPNANVNGRIHYIYWDQDRGETLITQSPAKVFNVSPSSRADVSFAADSPDSQFLIAKVVLDGGGNITSAVSAGRSEGQQVRTVTVGVGGQFTNLSAAINHINLWETQQDTNGSTRAYKDRYSQYEITLVSDLTVVGDLPTIEVSSLKIRGVRPDVQLILTAQTTSTPFFFNPTRSAPNVALAITFGYFSLENLWLRFDSTVNGKNLVNVTTAVLGLATIYLKNLFVISLTGAENFNWFLDGSNFGSIIIEDCSFSNVAKGIVRGGGSDTKIHCVRSSFDRHTLTAPVGPQIVSSSVGITTAWDGDSVHFEECIFSNWGTDQGSTAPILGKFTNTCILNDCVLDNGTTLPVAFDSVFVEVGILGYGVMSNCRMTDSGAVARRIFYSLSPSTYIANCAFAGPFTSLGSVEGNSVITAGHINNTKLQANGGTSGSPGAGIEGLVRASGNEVYGALSVGIRATHATGNETVVDGNYVHISPPYTGASYGIVTTTSAVPSRAAIINNRVSMSGAGSIGISMALPNGTLSLQYGLVQGNYVTYAAGAGNDGMVCIAGWASQHCNIIGNFITNDGATGGVAPVGIRMESGSYNSIIGNDINMAPDSGRGIALEGGTELSFTIEGNNVVTGAGSYSLDMNVTSNSASVISGNTFSQFVRGIRGCSFSNNYVGQDFSTGSVQNPTSVVGNSFFGAACTFNGPVSGGSYHVSGNFFSTAVSAPASLSEVNFVGNTFLGGAHSLLSLDTAIISENHFTDCSVTCRGQIHNNDFRDFGGAGSLNCTSGSSVLDGNQISITGAVAVGGTGNFRMRNNVITGAASIIFSASHSTGGIGFIDGNFFQSAGVLTIGDVSMFSNNTVVGSAIVINGGWSGVTGPNLRSPVSGNIFKDITTLTVNDCEWTSNTVRGSTGASTFTRCDMSGSYFRSTQLLTINISTVSAMQIVMSGSNGDIDLTTSQMSGCYVQCDDWSCSNSEISGSEFFCVTWDTIVGATYIYVSGCRIQGLATFGSSVTKGLVTGTHFISNTVFNSPEIRVTGCRFQAACQAFGANGNSFYFDACTVEGTFTFTNTGTSDAYCWLTSCAINILALNNTGTNQRGVVEIRDSRVTGSMSMTSSPKIQRLRIINSDLANLFQATIEGSYFYAESTYLGSHPIIKCDCEFIGCTSNNVLVDVGSFATFVTVKVRNCHFSGQYGATYPGSGYVGNVGYGIRIYGDLYDSEFIGNTFNSLGAYGGEAIVGIWFSRCSAGFTATNVVISENKFVSVSNTLSSMDAVGESIRLGDGSADICRNVLISNNQMSLTNVNGGGPSAVSRTWAAIHFLGDGQETTIIGNQIQRGAVSVVTFGGATMTLVSVKYDTASSKNNLATGNNVYQSNFVASPTITYSGDTRAQGAVVFTVGPGAFSWS